MIVMTAGWIEDEFIAVNSHAPTPFIRRNNNNNVIPVSSIIQKSMIV